MVIKRLRENKNWSQEQLAQIAGISLRTVQRVEAGNRASLETLKSLAAVFEVELTTLTEQIMVIDKEGSAWQSEPFYIRMFLWRVKKRSHMLVLEYTMIAVGFAVWVFGSQLALTTPLAFLGAYANSKLLAYVDAKGYW